MPQTVTPASPEAGAGVGAAGGAAAGALLGAFAGPPGIVVGAVIGAVAGGATGAALASDHDEEIETAKLDEEIGVSGGPMGAASPNAPKATRGTYSGASTGTGNSGESDAEPNEGPIPSGG